MRGEAPAALLPEGVLSPIHSFWAFSKGRLVGAPRDRKPRTSGRTGRGRFALPFLLTRWAADQAGEEADRADGHADRQGVVKARRRRQPSGAWTSFTLPTAGSDGRPRRS